MFSFDSRWIRSRFKKRKPAGIEYVGIPGVTRHCLSAIIRYIHAGDDIPSAYLLTSGQRHAFILKTQYEDHIAIKSGFSSGYGGTGPHGLSMALSLLERYGTDVDEFAVSEEFLDRLDSSHLINKDIDVFQEARPVRPSRWHDYIFEFETEFQWDMEKIRRTYPATIPFALVDDRIVDLALDFPDDEDKAVVTAYRRLEDIVRRRIGSPHEHGSKLFSKAFMGDEAPLFWNDIDSGESKGRANLFIGTWMAYRNRRAHREDREIDNELQELREFLLVNQLYRLESEAVLREGVESTRLGKVEDFLMQHPIPPRRSGK